MAEAGPQYEKITYLREVRPPTLAQYLIRRAVAEASAGLREEKGVSQEDGRVLPRSSLGLRARMKGVTAEELARAHPEWVEEYERTYGKPGTG